MLSFNRLSTLPGELNQLRAITTLDISFNEFKVIPQCVAQLRSLQVLNVASNAIEAIDDLGNIDALTYFNASGNKLKKFPAPLLKNLRLKTITLAANQIETIPADITKLITLESLDLSSNAVQDFSQVASCQSIMELNLANNQITKVPKGLQAMQCLQDLNLSRNKLIDFPYDCSVFQMGRLINLAHNEIKAEKGGSLPHFTRDRNTLRTTFIYNGNPELDKLISPQSPQQQQQQQQQQASLSMSSSAAQMSPFNVRVGWAEMRGKRPDMQDAFCVHTAFQNNSGQHLLGLYDGHSGSKSSLLLAKSIAQAFAAQLATGLPPEKALYAAYDAIEKEVEARKYSDGSTALTLFISGATLYTANTGDSKAVLASAGAAVDLNTFDRPDSEAEALRIRSLGGFVTQSGRVNGELALSKSIGDCVLRPYVTWEPTIKSRTLRRSDEFIIIGCDGLWDYVSSQEAVRIVRSTLHLADPFLSATTLRDAAYSHGSTDNISVVVAFLK